MPKRVEREIVGAILNAALKSTSVERSFLTPAKNETKRRGEAQRSSAACGGPGRAGQGRTRVGCPPPWPPLLSPPLLCAALIPTQIHLQPTQICF